MIMPWRLLSPTEILKNTRYDNYQTSEGEYRYYVFHTSTRIGRVFDRLPAILGLAATALFYLIYGTMWIVVNTILGTIDIVLRLFTESWGEF